MPQDQSHLFNDMDKLESSEMDEINSSLACAVSFIFNSILIYAIMRAKTYSESIKKMQIFSCFVRLLFSASVILGSPTLAYVVDSQAVYIVKGGFDLPMKIGVIILVVFLSFVVLSCTGPTFQFFHLLFIITKYRNSSPPNYIKYLTPLLSLVITLIATFLVSIGYIPDSFDDLLSSDIVFHLNGEGESAYLIASMQRYDYSKSEFVPDYSSWACSIYLLTVLIFTTISVFFCYFFIHSHRNKVTMSANLLKTQNHLVHILILQFALPFLTIHIPFYISFLLPFFEIESIVLSAYLPFLFSWCPALSPILIIIMVKQIREILIKVKKTTSTAPSVLNQIRNEHRNPRI